MNENARAAPDPDAAIAAAANQWALRLADGPLRADELDGFVAWVDADPAHEAALRQARDALRQVSLVAGLPEYEAWKKPSVYERVAGLLYEAQCAFRILAARVVSPGRRRRRLGLAAAGCAALAAVAVPVLNGFPGQSDRVADAEPDLVTAIAEIRDEALPDGSTVTLGAASAMDIDFTETERRVTLTAGEAFFDVETDADRPFLVVAGKTVVRVAGTSFDVSLGRRSVDIAVAEGRVEVIRAGDIEGAIEDEDIRHVLTAGQRVSADGSGRDAAVEAVPVEDVAAWRRGELIWIDTTAEDIVGDLNRYAETPIRLGPQGAGAQAYTLAVTTRDIDAAVALLASSMGLKVSNQGDGVVLR